jgi:hypothetical protein
MPSSEFPQVFRSDSTIKGMPIAGWLIGVLLIFGLGTAVFVWLYVHRREEQSTGSDQACTLVEGESSMFEDEFLDFIEQDNPLSSPGVDTDRADIGFGPAMRE